MAHKNTRFEVRFPPSEDTLRVNINTRTTEFSNGACQVDSDTWTHYWVLDLALKPIEEPQTSKNGGIEALSQLGIDSSDSAASAFLKDYMSLVTKVRKAAIIRFVFSCVRGYLVRSDFLEQRLECCAGVERVESFISPLHAVPNAAFQEVSPSQLSEVLNYAIGSLLLQDIEAEDFEGEFLRLDNEFKNRFSFSWLQADPIPRRRIAWVQGRENIGVSRRAYEAARALGVSIVMIDNPGHWLEDDHGPYAHLREAFIPMSIEVDQGFTQRIVDAVRGYKYSVDGLTTISDMRLPGVAEACEILGLPTSPYTAFQIAGHKGKTRMLEADAGESVTLSNATELSNFLNSEKGQQLAFPLVVKPSLGWNSDCVSKVWNLNELVEAVQRASERHADAASPSLGVVIEPYIEGPEVDANLVLLDGQVVYFDIEDDFPTRGDASDAGMDDNFQETQVLLPSVLPKDEIQLLCESLRRSILRQGFTSGVFHCEARVRHSTMIYTDRDGIFDMQKKEERGRERSIYLHEINARPPGYLESVAVTLTHGVDYYALQILLCIGSVENSRVHALCNPFLNGPQFHLCILIIPQTRAGIMKTEDAGADLLSRNPELRKHVPDYDTYLKRGAILEGPSARSLWWVANFSVISRTSRLDCIRRARFIQENFIYELE
ncbi:hypothetical protein MMC22_004899 [Lobaria immixta]|nr:hypothetical protein [Lobaria immixta]